MLTYERTRFFIAGVILTQGIPVPVHTLYVDPVRTCGG